MYVAGGNQYGRFGVSVKNSADCLKKFVKMNVNTPVKLASKGNDNYDHTFVYTLDNKLYGCGSNQYGL